MRRMTRRNFLAAGMALPALPALAFQAETSKLKITSVRVVRTRARRPLPRYTPAPGSWSTTGVEVASPMSVYPEYKAERSLFMNGAPGGFTVEVGTDKGVTGLGSGGAGGAALVQGQFARLLMGRDPFDIERNWDILFRSSYYYDRAGIATNAISGLDLALWDLIGKALGMPVYKLLGGETKPRIPAYCTGNDMEQHVKFGFKRLKLAVPHGPADGREGMRKNVELVKTAREIVGLDGDIMLDCWMAWTEPYTVEMAEMVAPCRVYWMEEVLPPHDYAGFGRLNAGIKTTKIATGEHEYTRYGFRQLLEHRSAAIWQPDAHWCGGLTELRRIAAMAAAYDIPIIPHGGGEFEPSHFVMATTNSPWAELFMPAPGGPPEVYQRFEEDHNITRGPEGIYKRPSDLPGLGWDVEVVAA